MMYKMSIQQEKGKKPFRPQVYLQRRRGQRRQNFDNRDRSRNNNRQRQNFKQTQNRCGNNPYVERSPTPRRYSNRQYSNPNTSSGTRSRSNSRVTTNRDGIRCFRCREYDHFANECPNTGTDDSDGYGSDSAALQLMTTDIDAHDSYDITRFTGKAEHLNL